MRLIHENANVRLDFGQKKIKRTTIVVEKITGPKWTTKLVDDGDEDKQCLTKPGITAYRLFRSNPMMALFEELVEKRI